MKDFLKIIEYDLLMESRKKISIIPYISFPEHWNIQIIPAFGGATIRFKVQDKNNLSSTVSVYLDCYDNLGAYGSPYWEIYPDKNGDNFRTDIDNIDELLKEIQLSLNTQTRNE